MRIELKFTDSEARGLTNYLRKYYKSRASFETLAKQAVRDIGAKQAKVELEKLGMVFDDKDITESQQPT